MTLLGEEPRVPQCPHCPPGVPCDPITQACLKGKWQIIRNPSSHHSILCVAVLNTIHSFILPLIIK